MYTPFAVEEGLGDLVREEHAAERRVAGGHALGARDDVRLEAEAGRAEPLAEAAVAGDDLVAAEQDAVAVADLAQRLRVARRRHEAAAGVLHGLDDHHRHAVGALGQDLLLDRLGGMDARVAGLAADGAVAAVGVRDVARIAEQRLEGRAGRRDAGQRERSERAAVVGAAARDHLAPRVLALREVVLARELPGRLDRLRAAGGEEEARQAGGREAEDALGQRERGRDAWRPSSGRSRAARAASPRQRRCGRRASSRSGS